jgi:hypothetical protein
MKTITQTEINEALGLHAKWLNDEEDGIRADFSECIFPSYANLRSANLFSANLRDADLRSADLSSADLSSSNLRSANLSYANLRDANLNETVYINDVKTSFEPLFITSLQWQVTIIVSDKTDDIDSKTYIIIGCQSHELEKWQNYHDESISKMDSEALDFWKQWKPAIVTMAKSYGGSHGVK